MDAPWTWEDCDQNEDQIEIATRVIFDALEDLEYFEWLEHDDASKFSPATAALIERALRDAHKERKHEAMVALRLVIRLTNALREELRDYLTGEGE